MESLVKVVLVAANRLAVAAGEEHGQAREGQGHTVTPEDTNSRLIFQGPDFTINLIPVLLLVNLVVVTAWLFTSLTTTESVAYTTGDSGYGTEFHANDPTGVTGYEEAFGVAAPGDDLFHGFHRREDDDIILTNVARDMLGQAWNSMQTVFDLGKQMFHEFIDTTVSPYLVSSDRSHDVEAVVSVKDVHGNDITRNVIFVDERDERYAHHPGHIHHQPQHHPQYDQHQDDGDYDDYYNYYNRGPLYEVDAPDFFDFVPGSASQSTGVTGGGHVSAAVNFEHPANKLANGAHAHQVMSGSPSPNVDISSSLSSSSSSTTGDDSNDIIVPQGRVDSIQDILDQHQGYREEPSTIQKILKETHAHSVPAQEGGQSADGLDFWIKWFNVRRNAQKTR